MLLVSAPSGRGVALPAVLDLQAPRYRFLSQLIDTIDTLHDTIDATMVKESRFTVNPFQELHFSQDDAANLEELIDEVLRVKVAKYEHFLTAEGGRVDNAKWKVVKAKDDSVVYTNRNYDDPAQVPAGRPQFPQMMMLGSIPGVLDDVVFGCANPTLEILRIKASYVGDLSGGAVLAAVVEPTFDQPFKSLLVKWMEMDLPFHSTSIVQNRDYVCAEATGITTMSDGTRVGYHVLHSVSFPQTPDLPNRVRANISSTGLFRQRDEHTVEVWGETLVDPGGNMIKKLVLPSLAATFIASLNYAYCAQMRKLAWMLNKKHEEAKEHGTPDPERICVTCSMIVPERKFGDFGKDKSTCRLCFEFVCSKCRIQKKLQFITPDLQMERRKVTFCVACMNESITASAVEVARAEIEDSLRNKSRVLAPSLGHSESSEEASISSSGHSHS